MTESLITNSLMTVLLYTAQLQTIYWPKLQVNALKQYNASNNSFILASYHLSCTHFFTFFKKGGNC